MSGPRSRAWGTESKRVRPSEARSDGVIRCGGGIGFACRAHGLRHDPEHGRVCPLCYARDALKAADAKVSKMLAGVIL